MVAMVSGRRVSPVHFAADRARMSAVGTIAQDLRGGRVHVWGSGCSPWSDPLTPNRRPYTRPPGTEFRLHATRGPLTARLLSEGHPPDLPFGDPVAALPRFYAPQIAKRWDLGIVLHLSEVAVRDFTANPKAVLARYTLPQDGSLRLITMIAPPTVHAIRAKIDEILACRRIVSTSLHGLAIAAAYGVPCLHLGADPGANGIARVAVDGPDSARINARFIDLYGGCGAREIVYWRQHRRDMTDWDALIRAVDAEAHPLSPDVDALVAVCPAGTTPLSPPANGTIWDHPLIRAVPCRARRRRWRRIVAWAKQLGRASG